MSFEISQLHFPNATKTAIQIIPLIRKNKKPAIPIFLSQAFDLLGFSGDFTKKEFLIDPFEIHVSSGSSQTNQVNSFR